MLLNLIIGLFTAQSGADTVDLSSWQTEKVRQLLYGSDHTVRVLYFGNSRVARQIGFAYDGIEDIAYESDRLAGNGFVVPQKGVGQWVGDVWYLPNAGTSMFSQRSWAAEEPIELLHAHQWPGVRLNSDRTVRMQNLGEGIALLPLDVEVVLTVQYLEGPSMGSFAVTPLEISVDGESAHPDTLIDANAAEYGVNWRDITLPAASAEAVHRSFSLTGVDGDSVVYRVNAVRDVPNGISVSEMGIGGKGYGRQAAEDNVPAASWTAYVAAYRPDIAFWQFAANQDVNSTLIAATIELMDRVESVNPDVLHIVTIDTPTPKSNSAVIVSRSLGWADALEGYHDAIVIDPTPYLPQGLIALQGTGRGGIYFLSPVHESAFGSRIVADAIWMALENAIPEPSSFAIILLGTSLLTSRRLVRRP